MKYIIYSILLVLLSILLGLGVRDEKIQERQIRECIDLNFDEKPNSERIKVCQDLISHFPSDSRIHYTISALRFSELENHREETVIEECKEIVYHCDKIKQFLNESKSPHSSDLQALILQSKKSAPILGSKILGLFKNQIYSSGNESEFLGNQNRKCLGFKSYCYAFQCRYQSPYTLDQCFISLDNLNLLEIELNQELTELNKIETQEDKDVEKKKFQYQFNLLLKLQDVYKKKGEILFFLDFFTEAIDNLSKIKDICSSISNKTLMFKQQGQNDVQEHEILMTCLMDYFQVFKILKKLEKYEQGLTKIDEGIKLMKELESKKLEVNSPKIASKLYLMIGELYNKKGLFYFKLRESMKHDKTIRDGVKYFSKAQKFDPNNNKIYLTLSKAYLKARKYQKAISNFEIFTKLNNNEPMNGYGYGDGDEGNILYGNSLFSSICHSIISDVYLEHIKKPVRTAIKELSFVIDQGKYAEEFCRLNRAALFISENQYEKAEKDISVAIYLQMFSDERKEKNKYLAYRSGLNFLQNKMDNAIKDCNKILKANKYDRRCLELMFLINCQTKKTNEANITFSSLITNVNPSLQTCVPQGNTKKKKWKKKKICKEYALRDYFKGNFLSDLLLFNESTTILMKTINEQPSCSPAYFQIGKNYIQIRKYEEAINFFTKSIQTNEKCVQCYYNRGLAKKKIFRFQEAIEDFKKAISIEPGFLDPFEPLLMLLEISENFEGIKEICQGFSKNLQVQFSYICSFSEQLLIKHSNIESINHKET